MHLSYQGCVWVLRHQRRITPLIAALTYIAAAAAPCPPAAGPSQPANAAALASRLPAPAVEAARVPAVGHEHHPMRHAPAASHHPGDTSGHAAHEMEGPIPVVHDATLAAPCPCGCDEHTASGGLAKRLGPIVLPGNEAGLPQSCGRDDFQLVQTAPKLFPSVPDPIPIAI